MGSSTVAGDEVAENWQTGLAHHRAGRPAEASACLRAVLAAQPAHAGALHLLGVIEQSAGHYRESVALISAAIRIDSASGDYRNNLANTFDLMGDLPQAAACYREAIALNPTNLYALDRLARVQARLGETRQAAETCRTLLLVRRQLAHGQCRLGDGEKERGGFKAAAEHYRKALSIEPRSFEAHHKLAAVLFLDRKFPAAAGYFGLAARMMPKLPALHSCQGAALQACGQLREAAKAYHRALELNPDDFKVLANLSAIFTELGNFELSLTLIRRCLALEPESEVAYCNLGALLSKSGDFEEAKKCFDTALEIRPGHASTLCNLGLQLELAGDLDGGARHYRQAIAAAPDSAKPRFFLSQVHLAQGDFEEGWTQYEARWETPNFLRAKREFEQPQWRGEPIAGKRIFVFAEQGLGDTLHFVRYLRLVAEAGAEVTFEVQPRLHGLLGKLAGAARVIRRGDPLPDFDFYCPLMSLPLAFRTTLESIPHDVPYVHADEAQVRLWSRQLAAGALKVGIAWAGNPSHTRERFRSIPLEKLARLSRFPRTALYSLQKGPSALQADTLTEGLHVVNLDAQQQDFADTAAIVANLDLVLSIDTSVAHLAGAMGKPVWILLHNAPDWRWLREREDSPWYPTARLFRQTTPGDWDGVVDRIEAALGELLGGRK